MSDRDLKSFAVSCFPLKLYLLIHQLSAGTGTFHSTIEAMDIKTFTHMTLVTTYLTSMVTTQNILITITAFIRHLSAKRIRKSK